MARPARGRRVRPGEEALVVEELGLEMHVERRRRGACKLQHRRREAAREHGLVIRVEPREARVGVAAGEELGLITGADVARVLRQVEDHAHRRRAAGLAGRGRHLPRPADDALVVVVDQDTEPVDVDRFLDAVNRIVEQRLSQRQNETGGPGPAARFCDSSPSTSPSQRATACPNQV